MTPFPKSTGELQSKYSFEEAFSLCCRKVEGMGGEITMFHDFESFLSSNCMIYFMIVLICFGKRQILVIQEIPNVTRQK